jgi:twitching motility protein PilT
MSRSAFEGMLTANQSLADLVLKGRVQPEDAIAQSLRPAELSQVLRGRT